MIEYNFEKREINITEVINSIKLFARIKQDWQRPEHMKYHLPIFAHTRNYIELRGWKFTKEAISNIRGVGIDIIKDDKLMTRYISIKTLIDGPEDYNTKIWDGELLELFNPKIDYRDFIDIEDKNCIFDTVGYDIETAKGAISIPCSFLDQAWIQNTFNRDNYPEYFL